MQFDNDCTAQGFGSEKRLVKNGQWAGKWALDMLGLPDRTTGLHPELVEQSVGSCWFKCSLM